MKRATFALVLLLVLAEAAYAFRTPSVRTRNRIPDEPPATVRMPEDAQPDPRKPHITIEGQPAPAVTVSPAAKPEAPVAAPKPEPETPKPAPLAAPKPESETPKPPSVAAPKPQPVAEPKPAPQASAPTTEPVREAAEPAVQRARAAPPDKPAVAIVPVAPPPPPPVIATPLPAPAAEKPDPAALPKPAPVAAPKPEPPPVAPGAPASAASTTEKPSLAPAAAAKPPAAEEEPKRKPIVALPKPDAGVSKPAAVVAAAAPSLPPRASSTAGKPDPRLIEAIFACLSPGLPNEWKKAWIVLSETGPGRGLEAKFFYSDKAADERGEPLVPCNAREVADRVLSLNELLPPEKRHWREARLLITSDGAYELKYDYPK